MLKLRLAVLIGGLALFGLTLATQRLMPKITPGIFPCKTNKRKHTVDYGGSLLYEANITKQDGSPLETVEVEGGEAFQFKRGTKIKFSVKFQPQAYPRGFGAYPNFMGLKISENYLYAPPDADRNFMDRHNVPMKGKFECSTAMEDSRHHSDAEACQWIKRDSESQCPLRVTEGKPVDLEFLLTVPNYPGVVSTSRFRLVPTPKKVSVGCPELGIPGGFEQLSDHDMICFKYNTTMVR